MVNISMRLELPGGEAKVVRLVSYMETIVQATRCCSSKGKKGQFYLSAEVEDDVKMYLRIPQVKFLAYTYKEA